MEKPSIKKDPKSFPFLGLTFKNIELGLGLGLGLVNICYVV